MQIIKDTAVITLTIDEFIKIVEKNLLDQVIALIITLDQGVVIDDDLFDDTKLDKFSEDYNDLFGEWLDEAKKILNDYQETDDEKVERLYESLIEYYEEL